MITEGVNKKAISEIHKIHLTAYKKIIKILEDPNNWGEIPLFLFLAWIACQNKALRKVDSTLPSQYLSLVECHLLPNPKDLL